jgi:hypothetical protein
VNDQETEKSAICSKVGASGRKKEEETDVGCEGVSLTQLVSVAEYSVHTHEPSKSSKTKISIYYYIKLMFLKYCVT